MGLATPVASFHCLCDTCFSTCVNTSHPYTCAFSHVRDSCTLPANSQRCHWVLPSSSAHSHWKSSFVPACPYLPLTSLITMNTIVVAFECPVWAHHGPCLAACCSHKKNSFHLVPFELCSLRSHFPVRTRYHKNSVCGPGIQNMLLQALGLGFQLLGRSTSSANVNTLLPLSQNKGSNSVWVPVSSSADWCWSQSCSSCAAPTVLLLAQRLQLPLPPQNVGVFYTIQPVKVT